MMKFVFFTALAPSNFIFLPLGLAALLFFLVLDAPLMNFKLHPEMEFLSLSLVILTSWLLIYMVMANYQSKSKKVFGVLMKLLLVSLCASFFSPTMFFFYFYFEVSLIPIFWIVMGWGYQPERLLASLMMFFYTLLSSFPLLASFFLIWMSSFSSSMPSIFFLEEGGLSLWISFSLTLAFLVKFPMYSVHLWLPKAHVEAPVSGSMILAGILLKLGGYGLFRLSFLFSVSSLNKIFSVLSIWGAVILACLCCRLSDMKVVIAYSSVVHMSMIIVALLSMESVGVMGTIWVMVAHGLVSSGLFACANIFYEQTHSRSLLFNKGLLSYSPALSLTWFLLLMMNFGGPFTLNLFGEINLILCSVSFSLLFLFPVFLLTFFSAAYSLVLYSSVQQGSAPGGLIWLKAPMSRELALLGGHIWPVIFILLDLNI